MITDPVSALSSTPTCGILTPVGRSRELAQALMPRHGTVNRAGCTSSRRRRLGARLTARNSDSFCARAGPIRGSRKRACLSMGNTQGAQAVQGEVALPAAVSTGYEGEASALRLDDAKRSYHSTLPPRPPGRRAAAPERKAASATTSHAVAAQGPRHPSRRPHETPRRHRLVGLSPRPLNALADTNAPAYAWSTGQHSHASIAKSVRAITRSDDGGHGTPRSQQRAQMSQLNCNESALSRLGRPSSTVAITGPYTPFLRQSSHWME